MKRNDIFKNSFVSFFSQLVILILGLLVPKIIITNYGSDCNGLINTITQVFTYLALLEAGISQACTNALYKPLKEENAESISILVSSTKYYFRKTSVIYGFFVIALSFLLPLCIKTEVSYWDVFLITFFEGLTNIVSFYFINPWICVFNASGKNYIVSYFNLFSRILCFGVKIILCLQGVEISVVQIGYFIVSLIKLLLFYIYYKTKFGWIKNCKNYCRLEGRKSYVITEFCSVIFMSTDIVLLSLFVSTSSASVYSIYNLILSSLSTLLNSVFISVVYILNQTYIEDVEKYKETHDIFNSFFIGVMTIFVCISFLLITPFVKLYTNGTTDIEYVNKFYPFLFCLIPLISWFRYIPNNLAGISGNFKKNAVYSIIESALNVSLSIILVFKLEIIGVLIATIASLPVRVILLNYLSEKRILKRNPLKTILIIVGNLLIYLGTVVINEYVNFEISTWQEFVLNGILLSLIYIPLVFTVNYLINPKMKRIFKLFKDRKRI